MKVRAVIKGLDNVMKSVNPERYKKPIAQTVEKHARKQANISSDRAPVDTGALAASIPASVEPMNGDKTAWKWGTPVIYGRKQEYTHKTKKGFIRKTAFEGEQPFVEDLGKTVQRVARGN